jgi:beta-glucosidase
MARKSVEDPCRRFGDHVADKMMFLWGAATSSHQVEGNNCFNDWWDCESKGFIKNKVCSGLATDHWNRFREDLDFAASLNLNTYRFSIEWSRLEPREGEWDLSALDWYVNLVHECERRNLIPMISLHHFTLPQWLAERGGIPWEQFPAKFAKYVEKVVAALGPRVPLWCTVNEPVALAVGKYLAGFMPPAQFSPTLVGVACRNLFRAHVLAYDLLHGQTAQRTGPWKDLPLSVGFAHNMMDFLPARVWHPLERAMARVFWRFYNAAWLDAVTGRKQHFGVKALIPRPAQVLEGLGRCTTDFIGINYYTKGYLRWGRSTPRLQSEAKSSLEEFQKIDLVPVRLSFTERSEPVSQLGWALHPEGLGKMIQYVRSYRLPILITENGIADPEDKARGRFITSHLTQIAKSIENGADVRGYYHWSLLDNFEWMEGYAPRFGLAEVNYETFERRARPSARLYQRIIELHRANESDYPQVKYLNGVTL